MQNKTFSVAFDVFKRREKDSKETTVDRLEKVIQSEGHSPQRGDVVSLFKELESAGCGKFWVGRRGAPSRFAWDVSLRSVGRAAASITDRVDDMAEDTEEDEEADFESGSAEDEAITHSFHLRPGVCVRFSLPADLTPKEASRLADFVKTLPFDTTSES